VVLVCIYTNTLYITIIVVFLTAFLHMLVYLVLIYTMGMTLLKIYIYQIIRESSGAQNASTEQEPNASDNLHSAEIKPSLDSQSGNAAAENHQQK